jgi:uncharacterized membrane protein
MKSLRRIFVTGLLVLVPFLVTLDIVFWLVRSIDGTVRRFIFWLPLDYYGVGLLVALGVILLIGLVAQNFIGHWVVNLIDSSLRRVHIIGGIYGGIKKFLETILNPRSDKFSGVVLVSFPREGIYSIGFRTGKPDPKLGLHGKDLTSVFIPCTPNPTSGFYLLVPEHELITLSLSVQEAFRIVISMGLVTSDEGAR